MQIKPVILCGGAGTRLWPKSKKNIPKQFIDFGGWNLFQKTLQRIQNPVYEYPIISTNLSYLNLVKKYLAKYKIKKYKIVLEPYKKNTASAILSSVLLDDIPFDKPILFFPADHLIERNKAFNKSVYLNSKKLNENNIFIFGIKPKSPSSQYGYFLTKKIKKNIDKVVKFIEKPNTNYAKKIIKNNAYWNSGIIFARKDSIINNFKIHQPKTLRLCLDSVLNAKASKNVYYLEKKIFKKIKENSFDYAILEKSENINALKLNIPWSDLGSWKEIANIFNKNKSKYFKKSNVFYRPWGKYTNLYSGKGFLIKELVINSKSSISLQKHNHRSEYWTVTSGKPKITINKKNFFIEANETAYIPQGAIHRIENPFKKPVKIMEVQTGKILKETDIIRYKDIYGRVN
tara:strand:- start:10781 stop:11986 length:1206 start_codon:yes stop_codon:yes gene_type:complete